MGRVDHDRALPWELLDEPMHGGVARFVADLGRVYCDSPALWAADHEPDGFAWIDAADVESSVYSWIRRAGDEVAVVVLNLTPIPRHGYRLGLPHGGRWVEALNSDSSTTAARTWATSAGSTRSRRRGTGSPGPPR